MIQARMTITAVLAIVTVCGCSRSPEARRDASLTRGKAFLQKQDYSRAILEFKNAAQLTPKHAESYYQLGLALLSSGDFRNGVMALRRTLDLDAKHPGAQLKLAELFIATGDGDLLTKAESMMSGLLRESPKSVDVLHHLGLAEWQLGKRSDAQRRWEEALLNSPEDIRTAGLLARAKLATNDAAGAEAVLKQIIDRNPKNVNAVVTLAEFYIYTRRLDQADAEFRRALRLDPVNSVALVDLAMLEDSRGRKAEAENLYKQASVLPDMRFKHLYALHLYQTGRQSAALAELQRLVRERPDDRDARTRLVRGYLLMGKISEAEKLLAAAIAKNRKDVGALTQRSRIHLYYRRYAEAESDLASVLRFEPRSAEAHYLLSRVHAARGLVLSRRQELDEALKADAGFLPARLELAELLIASRHPDTALEVLDKAPADQKRSRDVQVQRNWALISLGQIGQAQKTVQEALKATRDPDVLLQDALMKLNQSKYGEARASLEEVLRARPEDLRALTFLVRSYTIQKQNAAAARVLNDHAAKFPKSAPIQTLWAHWLLASGKRNEARQALVDATTANADYTPAALALAGLNIADGKTEEARTHLTSLLSRSEGSDTPVRLALADIDRRVGKGAAALKVYKSVADAEPGNVIALNNTAFMMADLGTNLDEALKYAQKAKELAPEMPAIDDTLGWVLYHKGMHGAAVRHLTSAASADTTGLSDYHLAMAHRKLGDEAASRKALATALKKNPQLEAAKRAFAEVQR